MRIAGITRNLVVNYFLAGVNRINKWNMFSWRLSFRQLPVTNNFHFIRFFRKRNNWITFYDPATAAKKGVRPQKYHGKLLTGKTSSTAVVRVVPAASFNMTPVKITKKKLLHAGTPLEFQLKYRNLRWSYFWPKNNILYVFFFILTKARGTKDDFCPPDLIAFWWSFGVAKDWKLNFKVDIWKEPFYTWVKKCSARFNGT